MSTPSPATPTSPLSTVYDTPSPSHPPTPINVAVCVPHGRDLTPIYHTNSYQQAVLAVHYSGDRPIITQQFSILGDEYARARNGIVDMVGSWEAEHQMKFDYLFWIDDDMVLPPDVLPRLLAHNKPIVSGVYVMRKPPFLPVAYYESHEPGSEGRFWNLDTLPVNALVEVDAVGHGCSLIRRDVYDHLQRPYYAWRPVDWSPEDQDREDGNTLGEDMYFFSKARQAGYRIYLDTGIECGHVGTFVYTPEVFRSNQNIYRRTPAPGKLSILILAAPAPKPWDYNTMELAGLGGSESAVAYLADRLANRHNHTVYVVSGSAPNHIHGVNYRPYEAAGSLINQKWDVVIVSRWRDILPQVSANKQIGVVMFWAHDLFNSAPAIRYVYQYTNTFVTVSPYHASHTFGPCPENVPGVTTEAILPNGVETKLFTGSEEREPGRLIWTSNPNRGLPTAVRIFRQIRKRHPHMSLHVYGRAAVYGWGPDQEASWLPRIDEPGVYVHDPLPKAQLARELMRSWAWFYPTHWPETFCIAALEAQAAGTPVIANPYGALPDTVLGGILDRDIIGSVDDLMDEPSWELVSLRGKEQSRKLEWDLVSDMWADLMLKEMIK